MEGWEVKLEGWEVKLEGWESASWGGNINGPDGRNDKLVLAQQTRDRHSSNGLSEKVLLQKQPKIWYG